MNADDHPLMRRLHKLGDEKRVLVIMSHTKWGDRLNCRAPQCANTFLRHNPAKLIRAWKFQGRLTRRKHG
jgi:hypothetical protein